MFMNEPSKDDIVRDAKKLAEDTSRYMYAHGEEKWHKLQAKATMKGRKLDELVNGNAWAAVGIAAAIGVLIGAAVSKMPRR